MHNENLKTTRKKTNSMKFNLLFGLWIIFTTYGCLPKITSIPVESRIEIMAYELADDYANKNPTLCYTSYVDSGDDYITLGNIFKKENDEFFSKGDDLWLIEYKDEQYLNMATNEQYRICGVYAKVDIIGRVLAIVIDENSSSRIKDCRTGSSSANVIIAEQLSKLGKHWKSKTGAKSRILTANCESIHPPFRHSSGYVASILLTKSNFNKQLNTRLSSEEIKNLKLEDIILIISESNKANPL